MLNIETEGNLTRIDVRDLILSGKHPRGEILETVDKAPLNTVFEIHLPHYAQPLIADLKSMGINVLVKQAEPRHFVLIGAKL